VLDTLKRPGESTSAVLARAQSLVLLNVVVQQTFTFASGPSILAGDKDGDGPSDRLLPGPAPGARPSVQDVEHVGLLHDHDGEDEEDAYRFQRPIRALQDTPDLHWPHRLRLLEKPAKAVAQFVNPPVVGAAVAVLLGMVPALNHLFLAEDGAFYTSVTKAVTNLGQLFVSLQMFTVGAQLRTVPRATPHAAPTAFVLAVRYALMPALAVGFVWATAARGWYAADPLVWFLLVLIPSGPSAMILANLAELVDVDQGPIAAYLTIAYMFSPLIALACTAGLAVVQAKA
jgi:predicted permease